MPSKPKVTGPTLRSIHTTQPQEYGADPDPTAPMAPVVTHHADAKGQRTGLALVRKRAYPTDLHAVCPNMPAVAALTLDTAATYTNGDGSTTTFPAGTTVYVADCTAADLAAWKATRTKRMAGRAERGAYVIDTRTPLAPSTAEHSAAARKAWAYRAATLDGAPVIGGAHASDGTAATAILAHGLARITGAA